jgi:threonine dehydratase
LPSYPTFSRLTAAKQAMNPELPGLVDIRRAQQRLSGLLKPTPLVRSEALSEITGAEICLKLESLQPTHSFKIRGAFNALMSLQERVGSPPLTLTTASAGNHGRAIAYAAAHFGFRAIVFTPRTAPETKRRAIRHHGAELRDQWADYDEAERESRRYADDNGVPYVSSYNDWDVIAGAGTVALEIVDQYPDFDVLVAPLGGGGLLGGLSTAIRGLGLRTQVIGVECEASTAFAVSLAREAITAIVPKPSIADGLVGNLEKGSMTFELVRRNVDRVVSVSEAELVSAIRFLAEGHHLIAEGAGAAAAAAVMARRVVSPGQRAVVVLSGSNIDLSTFTSAVSTAESLPGWADSALGATANRE